MRERERRVIGDFKEFWPEQLGIEEDCDRTRFVGGEHSSVLDILSLKCLLEHPVEIS